MKKMVFCISLLSAISVRGMDLDQPRSLEAQQYSRKAECRGERTCLKIAGYSALTLLGTASGVIVSYCLGGRSWQQVAIGAGAGMGAGGVISGLFEVFMRYCFRSSDAQERQPLLRQSVNADEEELDLGREIVEQSQPLVISGRQEAETTSGQPVQIIVMNNPNFLVTHREGRKLDSQDSDDGVEPSSTPLTPKREIISVFKRLSPASQRDAAACFLNAMPTPLRTEVVSRISIPLLEAPITSGPCGEGVFVRDGSFDSSVPMVHDAVVEKSLFDGALVYEGRMIHNQFSGDGCLTFNRGGRPSWKISGIFSQDFLDLGRERAMTVSSVVCSGKTITNLHPFRGFGECRVNFTLPEFAGMSAIRVSPDGKQYMLNNERSGVLFLSNGVYCGSVTLKANGAPLINGIGTFFYREANDTMTTWTGNFKDGKKHGVGMAGFDKQHIYIDDRQCSPEEYEAYKRKQRLKECPKSAEVATPSANSPGHQEDSGTGAATAAKPRGGSGTDAAPPASS